MKNINPPVVVSALTALVSVAGCNYEYDPLAEIRNRPFRTGKLVDGGFSTSERVSQEGNRVGVTSDGFRYAYSISDDTLFASHAAPGNETYSFNPISGDWTIRCTVNPMNDRRQCRIDYGFSLAFRGPSLSQMTSLCLLRHDFPGRSASIRVDGGQPIGLGNSGCTTSKRVVNSALGADSIVISQVSWPYDSRLNSSLRNFYSYEFNEFLTFLESLDA